jgi:hypothetical protein
MEVTFISFSFLENGKQYVQEITIVLVRESVLPPFQLLKHFTAVHETL